MAKFTSKPNPKNGARAKFQAKPAAPRGRAASGRTASMALDMSKLQVVWPQQKQPVNLRIDSDIINWFRQGGAGYQTRMNAVLRAFVDAQPKRR